MIAILLVLALACASAAPRWRHDHSHLSPFDGSLERYLNQQMFDTNRFWEDINESVNREMLQIDTMLGDFNKHFPRMRSFEGVDGNEYKITIPLTGFEEKDIVVKSRKGKLMIEAVSTGLNSNNYLEVRTLPVCVGDQGSWSYDDGVLKIVFPLAQTGDSDTTELTHEAATPVPDRSREETESPTYNLQNGDIDYNRGDLDKTNEIQTNEVPRVEATTYAVDMNDDVEFVPIQY